MNRLDIEWKILQYSRQLPESGLLEVLHYLEFLSQKNELQFKPIKRFNTMKVQQVIVVSREELHER
ncbi:hypothetical protein THII_1965 [Thioploca ingrica]|uniref:DUF2281 domain-containing protein n=1 Tax=Thioploca ingrica TaxID=40754 RepID=A0A090AKS0_9GAMM|nr:hypothetical protein THII_1965 [Thioploca ingrica]